MVAKKEKPKFIYEECKIKERHPHHMLYIYVKVKGKNKIYSANKMCNGKK